MNSTVHALVFAQVIIVVFSNLLFIIQTGRKASVPPVESVEGLHTVTCHSDKTH